MAQTPKLVMLSEKLRGKSFETLLLRFFSETHVHVGPLVIFALGGVFQIFGCISE